MKEQSEFLQPPDSIAAVTSLVIDQFYRAFQSGDYRSMQACYHEEVIFSDPVFRHLVGKEAKAMWHMLVLNGRDLRLTFHDVYADGNKGSCHWEAAYTFSGSGRKVLNVIDATFEFRDGKIYRHTDHFDLWRWSRMALGSTGIFLGWSTLLHHQIRKKADAALYKFIDAHPAYK